MLRFAVLAIAIAAAIIAIPILLLYGFVYWCGWHGACP